MSKAFASAPSVSIVDRPPDTSVYSATTPTRSYCAGRASRGSGMNAGAKRPTDVESPIWATVVHCVVVAATGDTVVLVVVMLVVLVAVTAVVLVVVGTIVVAAGATCGVGATGWMVVVADAAVGIAATRAGRVDAAGSISP